MAKTFGAVDKKQRKTRSDFGKKRKMYSGKPVQNKHRVRYEKRIGNKEFIKLWCWEIKMMSHDGYLRLPRWTRAKMSKVTPIPLRSEIGRFDPHVSEINTKEKMEQYIAERMWAGTFWVKGFSNAKNRYKCKAVRMCEIRVKETEECNVGKMTRDWRLSRYGWFYKG